MYTSGHKHRCIHCCVSCSGQKPFPCPKCDAFFSTKSNCERHLLRKHGVTNRTLRRNGLIVKKEAEDGSHESAGTSTPGLTKEGSTGSHFESTVFRLQLILFIDFQSRTVKFSNKTLTRKVTNFAVY